MNGHDTGDGIEIGKVSRPATGTVGVGTAERVLVKRSYLIPFLLALTFLIPFALESHAADLTKAPPGGTGQQALTVFSNDFAAGIGPYLEDPDGLFSVSGAAAHLAADHPPRGYLRTKAADYGVLDFRYEVTVGL
jgi:hypothetical protein